MKICFSVIALLCALSALSASAQLPQVKETTSDVAVESPPAGAPPANQPAPNKPKRSKSTAAQPQAASRHASSSEIKGFSFNRTFTADRASRPLIIRSGKVEPKTF